MPQHQQCMTSTSFLHALQGRGLCGWAAVASGLLVQNHGSVSILSHQMISTCVPESVWSGCGQEQRLQTRGDVCTDWVPHIVHLGLGPTWLALSVGLAATVWAIGAVDVKVV